MDIWTMQMCNWRMARQNNISILDITVKTGNKFFAPEYGWVMDYKKGLLSETDYTKLYLERMKYSLEHYPVDWETLFIYDKVAIACYCGINKFCHRHLFVKIMKEYLEDYDVVVNLCGELTKDSIKELI